MKKIINFENISNIVEELRNKNPKIKIVTTNGSFDILHSGHLKPLQEAKKLGDVLIVGLNSDESVKKYKSSKRPIINQEERAKMLEGLEVVDYIVIFNETDPRELLKRVKPDFHVKSKSGFKGIEKEVVELNGGKIILIEDIPRISTTKIINKILSLKK